MKVPVQVVFKSNDNKILRYNLHRFQYPFYANSEYFIILYNPNHQHLNMFYFWNFELDSCYKLGLRGYILNDWLYLRRLIHGKT